ncbi:MAG TPA: type II toxin-antitoxin system RelE/ParE family toxin [Deltaproteobacteria bacterium]|nr:type II toxin-antitoxin system RelE/ParE family toxin [Deltaproteobacteria bacterium]
MKVLFTPTGRRQFIEAIAYIYRDNPSAAVDFRRKAEKALSRLRKFSESGRLIPEFSDLPFREIIVRPYRFFYKIKDEIVWIIAVWHSAQLPEEPENKNG